MDCYVPADWAEWLQTLRIELNAMTTPRFVAWLDAKMAEHGQAKLIPPADVLARRLEAGVQERIREAITARILREADIDGLTAAAVDRVVGRVDQASDGLTDLVAEAFEHDGAAWWRAPVDRVADEIAADAAG